MRTSHPPDGLLTTFRLQVRPDGDQVLVTPRGELDLWTCEPLEAQVRDLCDRGVAAVCLDLRELSFFDSSALRLLLRLDEALAVAGCRFTIAEGDGAAAHVLQLTRMSGRFAHSPA
jgi:anti-anti-sigma factor